MIITLNFSTGLLDHYTVEQELNKRVEQAKAIEQGADVDIDALIEDVDQIMRAFSDVDEVVPSVEESLSPQGAR